MRLNKLGWFSEGILLGIWIMYMIMSNGNIEVMIKGTLCILVFVGIFYLMWSEWK